MIGIAVDATAAFGTGEHASTRGCLLALDALARRRRGACVSTSAPAPAFWRSPPPRPGAPRSPPRPRRRGGPGGAPQCRGEWRRRPCRFAAGQQLCRARVAGSAPYDLVFANILARPVIAMARGMVRAMAPGGVAVLFGLLRCQEPIVLAASRLRVVLARRLVVDGWSTLILRPRRRRR